MSSIQKFATIWCGIGLPLGVYGYYSTYKLFKNDNIFNYYQFYEQNPIVTNILFNIWAINIGVLSGLSWPIMYPVYYINEIKDK